MTDHLLSGAFTIVHDGAGYSRTAKFESIKDHDLALRILKVCWSGPRPGENCGTCEKCVRTRLNLMAVGVSNPPCFEGPLELNAVRELSIPNIAIAAELGSILRYARERGIGDEWVRVLQSRLKHYELNSRLAVLKEKVLGDGMARRAAQRLKGFVSQLRQRSVAEREQH